MDYFSKRLPHVLTRNDLTLLLAPTYMAARGVDHEEASERLARALASPATLNDLYRGLSAALAAAKGSRRKYAKAADGTPAISAALVRLDLDIGLAPESMRDTLASPRGAALLDEGLRALGAHVVKDLLK